MGLRVGELHFDLSLATGKFGAQLNSVRTQLQTFNKSASDQVQGVGDEVDGLTKGFGGLKTAIAGALAGGVIVSQIKSSIDAASDLGEAVNMTGLIFEDAQKDVVEWAQASAGAFGLSTTAALQAAAGYANLFLNVGLSLDRSREYSQQLVELSADMASAFNTTVPDAIQAISAGLRGEAEPLRRYGIMLDDLTLKEKARSMGLYDGKGVLDQSTKAQAAYAIILEKTARIQGDFANTAEDPANAARILQAEITNLKAALGEELLPLWREVLGTATETVRWIKSNQELIESLLKLAAAYGTALVAAKGWRALSAALVSSNAAVAASTTTLTGALSANFGSIIGGTGRAVKALGTLQLAVATAQTAINTWNTADAVTATGGGFLEGFATQYVSFLNSLTFGLTPLNDALNDFYASAETIRLAESGELITTNMNDAADAIGGAESEMAGLGKTSKSALETAREAVDEFLSSIQNTKNEILSTRGIFGVPDQDTNTAEADAAVREARQGLNDARADLARTRRDYREGSREVVEAQRAVAEARAGLSDARSAADEARGLSSQELLSRAQRNNEIQRQLRDDISAIRDAGFSDQALLGLTELENEAPGTIRRLVSEGITKPYVEALNESFASYDTLADNIAVFIESARNPLDETFRELGVANGAAWSSGFQSSMNANVPSRLSQQELDDFSSAGFSMDPNAVYGVNVYGQGSGSSKGGIYIQNQTVVASDPNEYRRAMESESRRSSLEGR